MPNVIYTIKADSTSGKQALGDFGAAQDKVAAGANKIEGALVKTRNAAQQFGAKLKGVQFPKKLYTEFQRLQAVIHANNKAIGEFGAKMKSAGGSIRGFGAEVSALSVAVGAVGVGTVYAAADFESQFTKIKTLVLGVNADTRDLEESVKQLAVATGVGPKELADAMFVVTSAGARGADVMDILTRSAKASALGLGETETIARAVTGAMQAFSAQGLTAGDAMDTLVATVREGNLEASDLAGSLGRVGAIASQAGLSFQDVGGFIASFTRAGVSAEESVTALRGVVGGLLKPAEQAQEAFAAFGTTAGAVRDTIKKEGLAAAMNGLIESTGGNSEAMAQLIPNIRALAGVLSTAGAQGESFAAIEDNIKHSTGILNEGFDLLQKDASFAFKQIVSELKVAAIEFGANFLPIVKDSVLPALKSFVEWLSKIAKVFGDSPPFVQKLVLALMGLTVAIGPLLLITGSLVSAVGTLTTAYAAATAGGGLFATSLTAISAAALPVAAVIGTALAAVAIGRLIGSLEVSGRSIDQWIQKWRGLPDVVANEASMVSTTEKLAKVLKEDFNVVIEKGSMSVEEWSNKVGQAYLAAKKQKEETEELAKVTKENTAAEEIATAQKAALAKETEWLTGAIEAAESQFEKLGGKVPEYTHELEDYQAVVHAIAKEELPDLDASFDRSIDAWQKAQDEVDKLNKEMDDFAEKVDIIADDKIPNFVTSVGKIPEKFKESFTDVKKTTEGFAADFTNSVSTVVTNFSQAVGDMIWEWEGFGDALKDISKEFISSLVSMFVESLFKPVMEGINGLLSGSSSGGSGGILGSLFGGFKNLGLEGQIGLGAAGAMLGFMTWLNSKPIEPNGKMPMGSGYTQQIEGTDVMFDYGYAGASGLIGNQVYSNVPDQTISPQELESMGLSPSDVGMVGFDSWADFYDSQEQATAANIAGKNATETLTSALEKITYTVDDFGEALKTSLDLAIATGKVSTQLEKALTGTGVNIEALKENALTAKNMFDASEQFASFVGALNQQLPQLDLGLEEFLATGVMTDTLKKYITDLGGDPALWAAYSGLFDKVAENQGFVDAAANGGVMAGVDYDNLALTVADLIATDPEAQQIVADLMTDAANLSVTAEERMQEAVDSFKEAVETFADAIYRKENPRAPYYEAVNTGPTRTRPETTGSTGTSSTSDGPSIPRPTRGGDVSVNVTIDSPITVEGAGDLTEENIERLARGFRKVLDVNAGGIADKVATTVETTLRGRGSI